MRQRHARVAEKAAQDRRAAANGRFATTANGSSGSAAGRVALDHFDARVAAESRPQLPERSRVELDRAHAGACIHEGAREGAAAGAEVEHERAGRDAGVADELVCEGAATKSVAAARPRLR